jgi:enoyl-CoA hydratase/carnithine racemase
MMETQDTVLTERRDRITTITLNRPEKHNAYTAEMMGRVFEEIRAADANDEVGCIVVRGAGPSFSSGFDLDADIGRMSDPNYKNDYERSLMADVRSLSARGEGDPAALWELQTPVIAQLHGYCLAGALDFATSCDFIVAADDAKIGYPIVKTIASPPSHMFTYLMGTQWTRYLLYTGNLIDGKKAAEIGLALLSVPVGELDGAVQKLASDVASTPTDLLAVHKSVCEKALDLMGRPLMRRLAIEADAMAHKSPTMKQFYEVGKQKGYKAAYDHLAGS